MLLFFFKKCPFRMCFRAVATNTWSKNTHPAVHKAKHVTAGVKDRSSVSLCGGVTTGHLRHCHRFRFHYNFIIGTSWVRGSARRLSRPSPPVGAGVRPLRAEPHLWYIPPSLPSAAWHCWSLAKDNMMKPSAWAAAEGYISPARPPWVERR